MEHYSFKEIVLAEDGDFLLSSNPARTILYQEHFKSHPISTYELKEILRAITSGTFRIYIIKVNNGRPLPPDDMAWVERLNLKRLFRAGVSHVAYVSPQNVFNSLELEREFGPGVILKIRVFKKINDAVQWLEMTSQEARI